LAIGSLQSSKWLLQEFDAILNKICQMIQKTENDQLKLTKPYFNFLITVARNETLRNKLIARQSHVKIYSLLKDERAKATTIFRTSDAEILQLLLKFVQSVVLGDSIREDEFSEILKQDLLTLQRYPDNCFLEHFFLPMIKSEPEIPVCLYPYDRQNKKWISDLQSISAQQNENQFTSKLLKPDWQKHFNQVLRKVAKRSGNAGKYQDMVWEKAFSASSDGDPGML
jgi:uncharacterized protein YihD (DUF1040 family)